MRFGAYIRFTKTSGSRRRRCSGPPKRNCCPKVFSAPGTCSAWWPERSSLRAPRSTSGSQRPVGVGGGDAQDRRRGIVAQRSSPRRGRARPGGRNEAHCGRHDLHPVHKDQWESAEAMLRTAEEELLPKGLLRAGDVLGLVAGTKLTAGATNFMRLHTVEESDRARPKERKKHNS